MNGIASFATNLDPTNLPPLPLPWTQHVAPTGHYYYYNPMTSESTYIRPISLTSLLPPALAKPAKRKREKPAKKTPVPDSLWIRVLTNRGNVFYANKETKESTWVMPEEIADAVAAMELDDNDGGSSDHAIQVKQDGQSDAMTVDTENPTNNKRRKRPDESVEDERGGKRAKTNKVGIEDAKNEDEDEEAWQRRLAEQMAVEGEGEGEDTKVVTPVEEQAPPISNEEATSLFKDLLREKDINPMMPWESSVSMFGNDERYVAANKVLSMALQQDMFEEYCKAVIKERRQAKVEDKAEKTPLEAFQELLRTTVTSTRTTYTQFRQQVKKDRRFYSFGRDEKDREKAFRAFLKELGEEKRSERKKAEVAFLAMLKEGQKDGLIVANPLAKWGDVKKHFQSDPRYDAVGSSSLREELFETFIKTIKETEAQLHTTVTETETENEKKKRRERAVKEREEKVRLVQQQVERDNVRSKAGLNKKEAELAFNTLLIDHIRDPTASFSSVISYLSSDPRFISISQSGSVPHSRLQAIYQAHIAHLRSKSSSALHSLFESYAPALNLRWDELSPSAMESIAKSGVSKRLDVDTRITLESSHSSRKRNRPGIGHTGGSHSNRDDTDEEEAEMEPKYEYPALRQEFERWQRQRYNDARAAFDIMLSENAFVEFWGRVGKMGLTDDEEKRHLGKVVFAEENAEGAVPLEEDPVEGEGGGGTADLQALAKGIDVDEVERVLLRDKRYIVFDYMPQERKQWIIDYLSQLSAPKASVHVS
ncbi:hypothetical protein FRB91_008223 [Serendipita sp. 411]|nr:hypothetical protein FRC15_001830 [Serendipita sp. 397]KAG8861357.1 hypothetical protein FRB91_008223 [Serendipita sp. 411]